MDRMRKSFGDITWDGVKDVGATPPRKRPKRMDSEYEPGFGSKAYFSKRAKNACSEKTIKRKLPFLSWMPKYNMGEFIADLVAGITVGFTIIPQGIAFAELANLPPQYGLYAGFIGAFVYIALGTTKEITIGPAAVICILLGGSLYDTPHEFNVAFTSLLCLISGAFAFLMGSLKLGVIVEFISAPVTAAFVTASAIVIIFSQFKSLLGLTGVHGETLTDLVPSVWHHLGTTKNPDMEMSLAACAVLIAMQEMKRFNWNRVISNPDIAAKVTQATFIVSSSRNALVLIACSIWAYFWNASAGQQVISLTSGVGNATGLPFPGPPPFWVPAMNASTVDGIPKYFPERGFVEMLRGGGTALFIIPIICIVEHIAVCKSFSKGKPVDVNQEMVALGITQMVACFFQSMPITGSICRSCVNAVSGVATPFGGIWSGSIVVAALIFFTPYMGYIPKPALGAIVVCAVVHMIEYEEAIHIWKTKKRDFFLFTMTFFCCAFIGLEWGFLIGVVINCLLLLIFAASPDVPILKFSISEDRRVVILKPDRSLHYPGIEKVRNLISKKALKHMDAMIVVDCVNLIDIDFTGAKGLGSVSSALKDRNQRIVFVNVCNRVEYALRGFTHGEAETYETAQEWIDSLPNAQDKRAIFRSLSSFDDPNTLNHPSMHYPMYENGDAGYLSPVAAITINSDRRDNGCPPINNQSPPVDRRPSYPDAPDNGQPPKQQKNKEKRVRCTQDDQPRDSRPPNGENQRKADSKNEEPWFNKTRV